MNKLILITLLTLSTITFNANATFSPEQAKEAYVITVDWIVDNLKSQNIEKKEAKEILERIKEKSQPFSISLVRRIDSIIRYYRL
jgi:hypothetical protein